MLDLVLACLEVEVVGEGVRLAGEVDQSQSKLELTPSIFRDAERRFFERCTVLMLHVETLSSRLTLLLLVAE